ncbi:hypothetical protein SAY87_013422 [Trapa incisa]|uniref:E3 ubiquitin-protein ligase RMA n=1 Tax=Trapa incisa TaxID=236973 RepID=A0AAN7QD37_9MYRT|nr:hypothetical protein SAY87_013422 [Trapa incisa]
MALEQQHAEEEVASHCSDTICKPHLTGWKSISVTAADSEDSQSVGFDCNICLETVQDPVVTLCGHLYCWPCIYWWLEVRGAAASRAQDPEPPRCPVCKAKVGPPNLPSSRSMPNISESRYHVGHSA